MKRISQQRGTAIIVALFMVGLVSVIAITMMSRLNRDIHRTELLSRSIQANAYAQGSIAWAADTLRNNWIKQRPNEAIDRMPVTSPIDQMQNYRISSTIYDAQAYFNLNNLVTEEWAIHFQRLLTIIEPDLNSETAKAITNSVANWISPGVKNMEDDLYYSKLPQPYRAAHRLMASPSELRLVKGVTPGLYVKLLPFVTALPETTSVNVNTAPAPVLQSLSPTLAYEGARSIEIQRQQLPFASMDKFLNLDIVRNHPFMASNLTVNSQYFLIETKVAIEKQQLRLYTLMQRVLKNGKPVVAVLWQEK